MMTPWYRYRRTIRRPSGIALGVVRNTLYPFKLKSAAIGVLLGARGRFISELGVATHSMRAMRLFESFGGVIASALCFARFARNVEVPMGKTERASGCRKLRLDDARGVSLRCIRAPPRVNLESECRSSPSHSLEECSAALGLGSGSIKGTSGAGSCFTALFGDFDVDRRRLGERGASSANGAIRPHNNLAVRRDP